MENDTRKLAPVPLSSLDTIEDPSGFWVFVSKTNSDGSMVSGKYLFDQLEEQAKRMQLERRISLTMESEDHEIFVGEEMTIYKIEAKNVGKLSINGKDIPNFDSRKLDEKIEKMSVVQLHIARQLTDPKSYLFIYAKAKLL